MNTLPTATLNRNVPADVLLLAEDQRTQITTTYYADSRGYCWRVADWPGCRPEPVYLGEVSESTGLTYHSLRGEWGYWRRNIVSSAA